MMELAGFTTAELARIGAAVAELAMRTGGSTGDAIARIEAFAAAPSAAPASLYDCARAVLRLRTRRNHRLGVDLFRDPAWDMLLELMIARAEHRTVSVSSLCFASGVPSTTALRHIDRMVETGLIVRMGDSSDHRRVLVAIAPAMVEPIEAMMRAGQETAFAPGTLGAEWSAGAAAAVPAIEPATIVVKPTRPPTIVVEIG